MMEGDDMIPVGPWKTAAMLGGPLVVLATLLALAFSSCWRQPEPVPAPVPVSTLPPQRVESTSKATSSSNVVASNRVTVRIPRQAVERGGVPGHSGTKAHPASGSSLVGAPARPDHFADVDEMVEIVIEQSIAATSSSEASAEAVAELSTPGDNSGDSHGRLGAILAFPVGLAVDYQLARVEVPPWLVGMPLELGLDVEANFDQVGAGVSVGGKGFATAGGFVGWRGPLYGYFFGVGMRF